MSLLLPGYMGSPGLTSFANSILYGGGGAPPPAANDQIYPGIPHPTYTNAQLNALGYVVWPTDTTVKTGATRPTLPSPWNSNTPNFYYVEQGGGNANEGYPGNPRGTIPDPIPAGAVVCVNGAYSQSFSDPANLTFNGTSANPAWLMGYNTGARPVFSQRMEVDGQWGIIDNINFDWNNNAVAIFRNHGSFMTMRNMILDGDSVSGGTYSQGDDAIWDNVTVTNAKVGAGEGGERHGCKNIASRVWFIDCAYNNNNGDGIQSGSNVGDTYKLVFCGGCSFDGNRQTGFWVKSGFDHIVSNCTGQNATVPSGASTGTPFGSQYGTDYYWILFSTGFNSEVGFARIASSSGGVGVNNYLIGNLSYNCGSDTTQTDNYTDSAVGLWGGAKAVVHNTFVDQDGGLYKVNSLTTACYGNIFGDPNISDARNIWINETTSLVSDYNVFENTASLASNGAGTEQTLAQWRTATGQDANSVEAATATLNFVNAASRDYHITAGSAAAINSGKHQAYIDFQNRYGLDIYVDRDGVARATQTASGCYEVS